MAFVVVALVVASSAGGAESAPAVAQSADPEGGPPSITIVQDTVPDAAQDFAFTSCRGADCDAFSLDDDADPVLPRSSTASGLPPGEYTITQASAPDWKLVDIFCDHAATVRLGQRRVIVDLAEAEQVTCTFTDRTQSITVVQDTVPNDPQDFAFTRCAGAECTPLTLDDDGDGALANSATATELPAGTHTVSQAAVPGWPLTTLVCNTGEVIDLATRTATITLTPAEHTTCTFTNSSQSITVVEDTTPDSEHDFDYASCPATGEAQACDEFSLDDDGDGELTNSHTLADLAPGTYRLSQRFDPDVDLQRVTCTTPVTSDRGGRRVVIELAPGAHPTCTFRNAPWPPPFNGVDRISGGSRHTCAKVGGQARCWGANWQGQLGDGTETERSRPVVVLDTDGLGPLTGVAEVAGGESRACARLTGGQARCWGRNGEGALGDGTTTDRPLPVIVSNPAGTGPLQRVADLTSGSGHNCALLTNGQARCWGDNDAGQLGDGTTDDGLRPGVVSNGAATGPLTGVVQLATGGDHTCALRAGGQASCWGWNRYGQLGDGTTTDRLRPRVVLSADGTGPLTGITQIVTGVAHTCALLVNGEVRCWGQNHEGELGAGVPEPQRRRPVVVSNTSGRGPLTDVVQLTAGFRHTCARLANRQLRCWGENDDGMLGDGTRTIRTRPVPVLDLSGTRSLTGVTRVSAGGDHTCATFSDGGARCWGRNSEGQVGDGTNLGRSLPVPVVEPY